MLILPVSIIPEQERVRDHGISIDPNQIANIVEGASRCQVFQVKSYVGLFSHLRRNTVVTHTLIRNAASYHRPRNR